MFFECLETDRLILKNINQDDREFVFSVFSDKVVTKYLYDEEPLTNMEGADEIINTYLQPEPRYQHRWILIRKEDGVKMGTCGFHCWYPEEGKVEVGYDLKEAYWGNGYMTEALNEIISFAVRKMKVGKIFAYIFVGNGKSINLSTKLGFEREGTLDCKFRGEDYLHYVYVLKVDNGKLK